MLCDKLKEIRSFIIAQIHSFRLNGGKGETSFKGVVTVLQRH